MKLKYSTHNCEKLVIGHRFGQIVLILFWFYGYVLSMYEAIICVIPRTPQIMLNNKLYYDMNHSDQNSMIKRKLYDPLLLLGM